MANRHETAVIAADADIGRDVSIGPFAVIHENVRIGDGCRIGAHVVIMPYTSLGEGCRIHAGAILGDVPQDLAFKDDTISYVEIGRDTVIREGVTIHRGTKSQSRTIIGQRCYLMAFSHIAHNVEISDGVIVANGALLAGYVSVGEKAFISGNCLIHQFVRIGKLAMLGGGSGIGQDVPPYCTTRSLSRDAILGLNTIGMRRAGMTADDRAEVKRVFDIFYRSGLSRSNALERLRAEGLKGPGKEFVEFVAASKRGICKFGR